MVTENDPLAEDEGPCTRCEDGWVTVKDGYALHLYPDPDPIRMSALDPEVVEQIHDELRLKRAAAANSVYPCRTCNPSLFFRWAGGHFKLGHDYAHCDECIEFLGGRRKAARAIQHLPEQTPVTTPRRDIDG